MSAERFQITDSNPNDAVGGCGCVCGDSKQTGCVGPYAVFYATETDNNLSPHVVLSLNCAKAVVNAAQTGEQLRTEAAPRKASRRRKDDELSI